MLQRILSRGEIEGLDHTAIPRVRLPAGASVFSDRAARLRQLAPDSPLADYLLMMAHLADGQKLAYKTFVIPTVSEEQISRAQSHGMPPLQAMGQARDPVWLDILFALIDHMMGDGIASSQAVEVFLALKEKLTHDPAALEKMADTLLANDDRGIDAAVAPIIMAALQVYWTHLAADFDEKQLPVVNPFGVCPCCGSAPVASIVRVGGKEDGCRYLSCSLCSTESHLVRVTCSHCQETKDISYHSLEGGLQAVRAESCESCRVYRKILYQEKDIYVDPIADDLASLALDVLMGEEGYMRASGNPLLWQTSEDDPDADTIDT